MLRWNPTLFQSLKRIVVHHEHGIGTFGSTLELGVLSLELSSLTEPGTQALTNIRIRIPEFTCLCPKTGQPDFSTLHLEYIPDQLCIELKSLKLYVWSFRNEGAFHEDVTNRILDDLVTACQPRFMRLRAEFGVRGGIYTDVVVEHRQPGWTPKPAVDIS